MGLKIVSKKKEFDNLAVCTIYGFVCSVAFANSLPKELNMGVHKKIVLSVAAAQEIEKLKIRKAKIDKKIKELQGKSNGTNQGK